VKPGKASKKYSFGLREVSGKKDFHIVSVGTVIPRFLRGLGSDSLSEKRKSANNSLPRKQCFIIF